MWLWLAVDDEGEVLDILVQKRWNKAAAEVASSPSQGIHPETVTRDKLASYGAAVRELGLRGVLADCRPIIALRKATCQSDDENGSNRNSSLRAQPKRSSPPTPPSTTASTSRNI